MGVMFDSLVGQLQRNEHDSRAWAWRILSTAGLIGQLTEMPRPIYDKHSCV